MSVKEQVLAILGSDEPDYARGAALGRAAVPHLRALVRNGETLLAAKAAYLASVIRSPRALVVLEDAASHPEPEVRLAAAAALRNFADPADSLADHDPTFGILDRLLHDPDAGVRKFAVRSAAALHSSGLRETVAVTADTDPAAFVRAAAREALSEM
jgi:HEAT repeat protein